MDEGDVLIFLRGRSRVSDGARAPNCCWAVLPSRLLRLLGHLELDAFAL